MNDYYISKLISVFLGLSILISSSIFIFSDLFYSQKDKKNLEGKLENVSASSDNGLANKNAFVESPPTLPTYYSTISLNDEFQPTGNLTDDLAAYAAREIIKTNPNGPNVDEAGNKFINIPDIEDLSTNFATSLISKVKLADWDEEYNNIIYKIKIDESNKYLNDYYNFFEKETIQYLKLNDILNETASPDDIEEGSEAGYQIVNNVLEKSLAIVVPKKLENFHKSFLKILIYQKNLFKDGQKVKIDPLYVAYNFHKNEYKYLKALDELNKTSNEVISLENNLFKKNSFFVKSAHAVLGRLVVAAIKALARKAYEWVKENWKKWLFETTKDQLIHRMVQAVIRWVNQGMNGAPQFVTNWKSFLSESASWAIGDTLYQLYPRICQPFRPLIQIAFQEPPSIYDEYPVCTLGDIVRNLENFYYDFKYGNWIGYGTILRPENNFYGALLISRDIALTKAAEETEARKSEAESGRGYLSMKDCNKYTNSDPIKKELVGQYKGKKDKLTCGPTKLGTTDIPDGYCVISVCDEPKNTTPGDFVAETVGQVVGTSPLHRIVNAQDAERLAVALFNSGLMKLIKAGQKGLLGTKPKDIGTGTVGGGDVVSDPDDPCFGEVRGTEEYNNCRGITQNPIYDSPASAEDQASLMGIARLTLEDLRKGFEATNEWLQTASSVQSGLETIGGCSSGSPLCPDLSQEACSLYDTIETMRPEMQKNIEFLGASINEVEDIIKQLDSQQLTKRQLNEFNDRLQRYGDISLIKTQEHISNLQSLESAVQQNIGGEPQCSVPLPSL